MGAPMSKLRGQVAEFHAAMGMKDPTTPTVPSDDRVRLRVKLVAEEFFEVMEAIFGPIFGQAKEVVEEARTKYPIRVDMKELADGMGDLDFVVEGTRLEFGVDGEPIADEIYRTNMAKFIGEPV